MKQTKQNNGSNEYSNNNRSSFEGSTFKNWYYGSIVQFWKIYQKIFNFFFFGKNSIINCCLDQKSLPLE